MFFSPCVAVSRREWIVFSYKRLFFVPSPSDENDRTEETFSVKANTSNATTTTTRTTRTTTAAASDGTVFVLLREEDVVGAVQEDECHTGFRRLQ